MEPSARRSLRKQKSRRRVENIGDGFLTMGMIRNPQLMSPHALNKRLAFQLVSRRCLTLGHPTKLVEQADSSYHTRGIVEPRETVAMHDRDDPRANELNNLRLALATFALQLDAFEARLKVRLTKPHHETAKLVSLDIRKRATKRTEQYPPSLPARDSFTDAKSDENWLMADHHSPAMPSTPK